MFALRFVYVSLNEYRALPSISKQRRKISIFWYLRVPRRKFFWEMFWCV